MMTKSIGLMMALFVALLTPVARAQTPTEYTGNSAFFPHLWGDATNWTNGAPFWNGVDLTNARDAVVIDDTARLTRGESGSAHGVILGGGTGINDFAVLEVVYTDDIFGRGSGSLYSNYGTIGLAGGQNRAEAYVRGDGLNLSHSTWTLSSHLIVGYQGTGGGLLDIQGGGVVSSPLGILGDHTEAGGEAFISGDGSRWNSGSELRVGNAGGGTLGIFDGGNVTNTVGYMGYVPGSTGTAVVDGGNSTWDSGELYVGSQGMGTLTIQNGGTVSGDRGSIGDSSGAIGEATVDGAGAGALWDSGSNLLVGNAGAGTLNVLNGGDVTNVTGYVGAHADGVGDAEISGVGSTWKSTGDLYVGHKSETTSQLRIQNEGLVESGRGFLGDHLGSSGAVTVFGEGSKWTSTGEIRVGNLGFGALAVVDGADVTNAWGYIGFGASSKGSVRVADEGSTWTNNGNLLIGDQSTQESTLTIENGGHVDSMGSSIGEFANSVGKVTVNDDDSEWSTGELRVGHVGMGTLEIRNGGGVVSADAYVNFASTAASAAIVDGEGSTWSSAVLRVGHGGTGTLRVLDGGDVFVKFGRIGNGSNGVGEVTVDGAGSTWTGLAGNSDITVGGSGFGRLFVTNGGVITVPVVNIQSTGQLLGNGTVVGWVFNNGGVHPGASPGTLQVTGEYTQTSNAALTIELASATSFDKLAVTGNVTLGGQLYVSLINGFMPSAGQSFDVLDWTGSRFGMFADENLPALPGSLMWNKDDLYTSGILRVVAPGTLSADFDIDGDVDGNDLTLWRNNLGLSGSATHGHGDADGDHDVDGGDFLTWQRQLGSPTNVAAAAAVPEPATLALATIAAAVIARRTGRRLR